ncbi:uncharacterized protein LOC131004910 [Salvia miltiorrhiza]|uniref:uncharacterized protein LOC131004910 n=1 Tax=Salvia miltiorrhiza TaxID=226208 RepID=UPI0025AB7081|nr:uncharacterized protein LOC131004910 [Salvia miltiorrhiza]
MPNFQISSLFAVLASNLRTPHPTAGDEVTLSLSNLNRSLNPTDVPRVRILDTALSLMHFTVPQVHDSVIEFTLKSLVTVLSSSIECKVVRVNKQLDLRVGGLILKSDCANVMEECARVLEKLDGQKGDLCYSLLYNVIRVAALAPCFPYAMLSDSILDAKCCDLRTTALENLVRLIPKQFTFKNGEIPLRLLSWHLDPMILKQDVAQVLQEFITRPFLSLQTEIYDRIDWRSKIICLVMSPSMFIETRALLHKWFLMTGLASLMELQSEIVGHVLDIISRPMWWGISIEVGSKLPFSFAYFPYQHQLLRTLAGPISQEYFKHLLQKVSGSVSVPGGDLHKSSGKTATDINSVDHKSMWAMVMNFPCWFFFASMMIFCNNSNITVDSLCSESLSGYLKPCMTHDPEVTCPAEAGKFMAWILYPMSESTQCLLVDYLVKISDLWLQKCASLNKCHEVTSVDEEAKKPKSHVKNEIALYELDSCAVSLWLKEIRDLYTKHFGEKVGFSTSNTKRFSIHQNLLLRRIPLGILLLHPCHLNAEGCSLLLHYAATGTVQEFSGIQNPRQGRKRWKHNSIRSSLCCIQQCSKAEAIAGCRTVFDITDVADSISYSMFNEEEGLNFVCQVKMKTCNYLLQCVKRLLDIKHDEDGLQMRRDLLSRVVRWRRQRKDVFQNKDLDSVCDALSLSV